MKNYRIRYVTPEGTTKTTVVAFDASSAETRKNRLQDEGHTDVEVFEVKPGE